MSRTLHCGQTKKNMQALTGISSRDDAPQDGHVIVAIVISRFTGFVRLTPKVSAESPASAVMTGLRYSFRLRLIPPGSPSDAPQRSHALA